MELPFKTKHEKQIAVALFAVWVVLFLPKLRTSPNWYGDEGEWMEKSWTFIHGTPRVGPCTLDFIFPYPYPPVYMLINGTLLRMFGNDLAVGRTLGAVTALAAAAILFWIGTRLRDKNFGFLCAAAFLVYNEANMNFRWVRSHPMAGMWSLACVGFLIRYLQERRLRDVVWAGVMCSLAAGTNYFTYPLGGAVVATAAIANWREWRSARAWGHVVAAGAAAGAYVMLFVAWYVFVKDGGGWTQLMTQVGRLTSVASNEVRPTLGGEVARFIENVWNLGFHTPTHGPPPTWSGRDVWLMIATAGFVFLPTKDWRMRLWVPFWLLVLMYGVFKKLNNVPLFFYPATVFLPLMAVGFAGTATWAGELMARAQVKWRWVPAFVALTIFGYVSLRGALVHFDSKIDLWSQHSVREAEEAMAYVNANTTTDDFVLVPKQLYWTVRHARKSMLTFCARYNGVINDIPVSVLIPRELYWFDCRLENAKYLVLASGVAENRPQGFDLVYTRGMTGMQEIMDQVLKEQWPVVYAKGQIAMVPTSPGKQWPVVVGGEYIVLANPRFVKAE